MGRSLRYLNHCQCKTKSFSFCCIIWSWNKKIIYFFFVSFLTNETSKYCYSTIKKSLNLKCVIKQVHENCIILSWNRTREIEFAVTFIPIISFDFSFWRFYLRFSHVNGRSLRISENPTEFLTHQPKHHQNDWFRAIYLPGKVF